MEYLILKKKRGVFVEISKSSIDYKLINLNAATKENIWKSKFSEREKILTADALYKSQAESLYKSLITSHPYLKKYKEYFQKIKVKNAYVTCMKQAVFEMMNHLNKTYKLNSYFYGYILNVNRSAVNYYKKINLAQRHPDYNEVISIMDKMIKNNKYPISKVNKSTLITEYTWKDLK